MTKSAFLPIASLPPLTPGQLSAPFLVICQEFGCPPAFAVARAWRSSLPGQPLKWYLDQRTYHLDRPYEIAEKVTHYYSLD